MGWARMLLLGDIGQQLDIRDARAELERLRQSSTSKVLKDREQDEEIASLSDENEQLRLCLIALVRLLVSKGVVRGGDVTEIMNVLDPPSPPASPGRDSDGPTTDDLIALAEAARRFARAT